MHLDTPRRKPIAALLALWLALALAPPARAAITAPALELVRVQAARAPSGVWLRLDGSFPQGDLIQQPFEIQVLIREKEDGARFVRLELPVGGFSGFAPALRDGFSAETLDAVLAASQPDPAARLLELAPSRIEVLLPADFPSGPAEATIFLIYRGEPLFSNAYGFEIPGAQP